MRYPVFHVPHDGGLFPEELVSSVCIPRDRFLRYHAVMRDAFVREMVPEEFRSPTCTILFPVSRLLCDPERFVGPEEVMERFGMGFCYEKAFDGTVIKRVDEALKAKTLRWYRAHHARVDLACLQQRTVLLDMHSFSREIVPGEYMTDADLPDVCIGTDSGFTPLQAVRITETVLENAGLSTAVNYPYSGCLVPNAALAGKADCISLMLEFNKTAYLDGRGNPDAKKLRDIRSLVRKIAAACESI